MPVVMKEPRFSQSVQATIYITGLSKLSPDEKHRFSADLPGGWKVEFIAPQTKGQDNPYAALWLYWPGYIPKDSEIRRFQVIIEVKCLSSEKVTYKRLSHVIGRTISPSGSTGWSNFCRWKNIWFEGSPVEKDDALRLFISLIALPPSTFRPAITDTDIFHNISCQINGGDVVDTKFYLFSARERLPNDLVRIIRPRPVYGNTSLLIGRCSYFSPMLSGTAYTESRLKPLNQSYPELYTTEYGYDSDSDLASSASSDSEEDDERGIDEAKIKGINNEANNKSFGCSEGSERASPDYNIDTSNMPREIPSVLDQASLTDTIEPPPNIPYSSSRKVRLITVKDTAYITWKAMVYYLYTSRMDFAPLKSSMKDQIKYRDGSPPKSSPKSMYRLADKLNITEICALAKANIELQLSKENIIEELFSSFTSRYPEIRDMEISFVLQHWDELKGSQQLRDKISEVAKGKLPHAEEVVAALLLR